MAENKTEKKRTKKLIIITVIALVLGFSLISFVVDMVQQRAATKTEVEQGEKDKEDENNIDYLQDIDMNKDSTQGIPDLIAATYKGAIDGNTIRVCVDNDEVEVYFAGVRSADKINGIGMTYRNQAREWINNRLTANASLYLEVVDSYADGSYTAYVYDQKDLDFTSYAAFLTHCINAEELLKGYGNVATDSIGVRAEWMYDAVDSAQSSYAGMWDDAESYRVCNYSVPERFVEVETESTNPETESEESKKDKAKKNKKSTEKIDSTQESINHH